MKSTPRIHASTQLINEMQLARLRVARTGRQLESAIEQARLAKRRRKEAKAATRRAKKLVRLAKEEHAKAKETLVMAEEQFAMEIEQAVQNRQLTQVRLRAKAAAVRAKKKGARSLSVRRTSNAGGGKTGSSVSLAPRMRIRRGIA